MPKSIIYLLGEWTIRDNGGPVFHQHGYTASKEVAEKWDSLGDGENAIYDHSILCEITLEELTK